MSHNNIIRSIAFAFSFLVIFSCSDALDKEFLSADNNQQLATRSLPSTADYYYWYNGEKINISSVKNLYYISSSDSLSLETMQFKSKAIAVKTNIKKGSFMLEDKNYWKIVELNDGTTVNNSISIASQLEDEDIYIAPVFGENEQNCIATSEYFYVKIKSEKDYQLLQSVAEEQQAEIKQ